MSAEHWDLDQDNTLGGNSPSPNKISSQKALKEYIDSHGGSITVDDALSTTSENPVQNKVITAVIGDIETALHTINSGV